ncbi:MAG: energy-coupling factor transporter transmembrane protein EcfT [Oscillospiraceae bacterium]|nr:energy-coupling factor transporter transmembrane protein EcfT [Oscillospiraceae bacterium]
MNRDTFSGFHPVVNILYFAVMIGFSMFFMHPISLALSLVCAVTYAIYLNGKKAVRVGLKFMLPMMLFAAALNPMFNHQGATILAYLPNGNPLTLESAMYGIAAAVMLATVITWFSCLNTVMTSDKFTYLFGRISPALSLILSMTLRMVPRFRDQIKVISGAQRCIGRDIKNGNFLRKARNGVRILSIMITWALENAIETADSMKARGYGLPGRTAFSIFRFSRRDAYAISYILACAVFVIAGAAVEVFRFRYFPTIRHIDGGWHSFWTVSLFVIYFALGALPIIVNLKEDLMWKRLRAGGTFDII